jgi:hypothetical protein
MRSAEHQRSVPFLVIVSSILAWSAACSGKAASSPTPTLEISNLRVRELGLATRLCSSAFSYRVWDELLLDVRGASELAGANIFHASPDNARTLVTTISSSCSAAGDCPFESACVVSGSGGGTRTVKVYAPVEWEPIRTWNVSVDAGGTRSNTATAMVARPDALPVGDAAGIAYLIGRRTSTTTGAVEFYVYSPGVVGRTIRMKVEGFAGGQRFWETTPFPIDEQPNTMAGRKVLSISAGVVVPPVPFEMVGSFDERNASGVVIMSDRRAVQIQ